MSLALQGLMNKRRRVDLTSVESIDSSGSAWPARFHPDGDFIAAGGNMTNKQVIVYSWNGSDTLAEVESVDLGGTCCGLDWHPDGDFLAATGYHDATNSVVIYSWNGTDTLASVEVAGTTSGMGPVHWHPSGDYLAVGTYNTAKGVIIYSWNGTDTLAEVEDLNCGVSGYGVRWSHDGDYLAVGSIRANNNVAVYGWNGTDTLTEIDTYDNGAVSIYSPRWAENDAYLFFNIFDTPNYKLAAASFNGTTLSKVDDITSGGANNARGVDVSGSLIACGFDFNSVASQAVVKLYRFNQSTETLSSIDSYTANARGVNMLEFSSDGAYLTAPMLTETNITLRVLKVFK